MTDGKINVDELRRLLEAATPGPWLTHDGDIFTGPCEHGIGPKLASFCFERVRYGKETNGYRPQMVRDAHVTTALRNAAPALMRVLGAAHTLVVVGDDEMTYDQASDELKEALDAFDHGENDG